MTIPSTNSSSKSGSESTVPQAVTMNADTFMKLFTQEISNQNPMEPMDSAAFLNQFSQITTVQTMNSLQSTMGSLTSVLNTMKTSQVNSGAQELVGRGIVYTNAAGASQTGSVESVRLVPGKDPQLVLKDGSAIGLDSLRQVM